MEEDYNHFTDGLDEVPVGEAELAEEFRNLYQNRLRLMEKVQSEMEQTQKVCVT